MVNSIIPRSEGRQSNKHVDISIPNPIAIPFRTDSIVTHITLGINTDTRLLARLLTNGISIERSRFTLNVLDHGLVTTRCALVKSGFGPVDESFEDRRSGRGSSDDRGDVQVTARVVVVQITLQLFAF